MGIVSKNHRKRNKKQMKMNIEQLIPKDVTNRDEYIKNILFNKINYLGVDQTIIIFKFKTDKPVYLDKINFIESDGFKLHNFGGEYERAVVSDDVRTFLPKEYFLKEWKAY